MSNQSLKSQFLNLAVIVAALGYFVDIYDLLLFTIVREPSLIGINIGDADIMTASMKIINWQMVGLLIGGVLWGSGLPLLGYYLGQFDIVKDHIEIAVLAVVAISLLPVVVEFINHRRNKSKHSAD